MGGLSTGGFSGKLEFGWRSAANERNSSYKSPDPFPSPALSGGLFAVWRSWWEESGTYDEKMTEWGGEHIEISLRTWMCGGRIEFIPCSHVAHWFRPKRPYVIHRENTDINEKRVALVWLDKYL